MEVIVAHEKHGTWLYATALKLLEDRVKAGYWYDGEDEEQAKEILQSGSESKAWSFLNDRSDYEYEYVEWQTVQEKGVDD